MRFKRTAPILLTASAVPVLTLELLTTWFEYGTSPFYHGEYDVQVSVFSPIERKYWNGLGWYDCEGGNVCLFQQYRWRGLADKPINFGELEQ